MSIAKMGLDVIPLSKVMLHEETLPEKTKYLQRIIKEQNFLKNPVIVVRAGKNYIVIDGNHRIGALAALSAKYVVAQVVNYKDVTIESWNRRVIVERDIIYLERKVREFEKLFGRKPVSLEELLERRLIERLPLEPFGGYYYLDRQSGEVKSSRVKERLKLYTNRK